MRAALRKAPVTVTTYQLTFCFSWKELLCSENYSPDMDARQAPSISFNFVHRRLNHIGQSSSHVPTRRQQKENTGLDVDAIPEQLASHFGLRFLSPAPNTPPFPN